MTSAHRDNLTSIVFRALFPEYQLTSFGDLHVVTPKGTPVFTGDSLGSIARQISDHEHPVSAAPGTPGRDLPRR